MITSNTLYNAIQDARDKLGTALVILDERTAERDWAFQAIDTDPDQFDDEVYDEMCEDYDRIYKECKHAEQVVEAWQSLIKALTQAEDDLQWLETEGKQ